MRKETDLARVKMIAHVLLDMPIAETSFSPAIVSHPFTSTGVTAAQNEDGNITVVDLLNNKEDYAKWKEMVGKQIDSAENACQVFFLLNKPYYLTFLKFSAPVLSQENLGQLLAHAWILEECPNQDRNVSKRELLALPWNACTFSSSSPPLPHLCSSSWRYSARKGRNFPSVRTPLTRKMKWSIPA